jgi:hypothetical protein
MGTIQIPKFGLQGFFTLKIRGRNGNIKYESTFENLITDNGLDLVGTSRDWGRYCSLGSGTAAPSVNDTTLGVLVATSPANYTYSGGASGSAFGYSRTYNANSPYDSTHTGRFYFDFGVAEGNLSEIGVGAGSDGTNLYCRSLIKDGNGDPTTITVLSNESLEVFYSVVIYPPLTDVTGTIGGYDYTLRAAYVTSPSGAGNDISHGWSFQWNGAQGWDKLRQVFNSEDSSIGFYTGSIGAITSRPSGTRLNSSGTSRTSGTYTLGSFTRNFTLFCPTNVITSTFRCIHFTVGPGDYQIQFSPDVTKTNLKEFTFEFSISWGRHTV